jgi:oligogalacturonide transport system substrate-binding protein
MKLLNRWRNEEMTAKKMLTVVGALVVGATLLTGCGSGKKEADTGKTTIRISWWGGDDRHKATLAAIKAFEKENPDIKVKAEYSGWDGVEQKMATQITGQTEPDIMQINYDWLALYSPTGEGFADLSKLSDLDLSGYDESTLNAGKVDGIQNAVPFSENAWVWGVNKTAFDKRNMEVPTTWDGYIEAAEKFEDGAFPARVSNFDVLTYLQQKTGKSILDDEGNLQYDAATLQEGLDFYQKLIDKKVIPTAQESKEQADANPGAPSKKALEGDYGVSSMWSAQISGEYQNLKDAGQDFILAPYPTIKGGASPQVINKPSMLFAISKNSKHQEAAAKLLNFLLNEPEGVKEMGLVRGVPVNQKAFDILEQDGQIDGIMKDVYTFVKETEGITESKYLEMSQVMTAFNDVFEEFSFGKIKSDEAATRILADMKTAVDQIKSTRK